MQMVLRKKTVRMLLHQYLIWISDAFEVLT
jgi:hypothetical protein